MKSFYTTLASLFLISTSLFAQNFKSGSIITTESTTIEGRIDINNSDKKVISKKIGTSQIFNFNEITKVVWGNKEFSIVNFNNEPFLAQQVTNGKATLYNLTKNNYLIKNDTGEGQLFNIEDSKMQLPGILSVLFKDCNSFRDEINKVDEIDERKLKELVVNYNNCDYGNYSPTENELKKANSHNTDVFRISAGFITSFNTTTVNNFDSNNTTGFGLGIGVDSSPSFMGNLQGNLFFDFDFSMIFKGDTDFNNGTTALNYKSNTFRLALGMKYLFNKNGTIQPFLGIGGGYTSDFYKGAIGTVSFKDNHQNGYFSPKAGVLYKLKNGKHIGLTVSYISEYENDLSFFSTNENDEVILNPFVINTSAITLGLSYYF